MSQEDRLCNGLRTVNCGTIKTIQGMEVELLGSGKGFSTHPTNIVCAYNNENGRKVELTYYEYKDEDNQVISGHEVYLFHQPHDAKHYYSRNYRGKELPKKYVKLAAKLKSIHQEVFH